MSDSVASTFSFGTRDERIITEDLPCFHCRYNLRTLHLDALCPECGRPIVQTLRNGWLNYCDIHWLRRIRGGIDLGIALFAGTALLWFGMMIYILSFMGETMKKPSEFVVGGLTVSGILIIQLVWLTVVLFLTTPHPSEAPEGMRPRRGPLAWWIVFLTCFQLFVVMGYTTCLGSALIFGREIPDDFPQASPGASLAFMSLLMLAGLAFHLSLLLLVVHMRRIARRDPAGGLAKLMTVIFWGWIVFALAGTFMFVGMTVNLFSTGSPLQSLSTPTTVAQLGGPYNATVIEYQLGETVVPSSDDTASDTISEKEIVATTPDDPTATGDVTTQPTTTAPAVPAPTVPRFFYAMLIPTILLQCFSVIWMICIVVAIFWFRSILSRAIYENRFDRPPVAA